MQKKHKLTFLVLSALAMGLSIGLFLYGRTSAVLNPKGIIAVKELDLMATATLLMLIVVLPVCLMTFFISLRYRATNKNAKYKPDWDNSWTAEFVWWGFPLVIIGILSWLTWTSSHELDPYRPIETHNAPLKIQVIALQWKWLFLYPEQKIATLNYVQFPEETPIHFELTADAPMNSFWIPQLGGQIYAMPGMRTQLYLVADEPGEFRGSTANLSGEGFAEMTFMAKSSSKAHFDEWVETVREAPHSLDLAEYNRLAKPGLEPHPLSYQLRDENLFNQTVMKFMMPMDQMAEALTR